jgi:hypothetical protein
MIRKVFLGFLFAATPMFAAQKVNQQEYESLLAQCRIINQYIYDRVYPYENQIVASLGERLTATGAVSKASIEFKNAIRRGMQINHDPSIDAAITQYIYLYLQKIGTVAAAQLLTDIISNKACL